jgi:hypothetical protein
MNKIFHIFLEVLGISILSCPCVWEVWNDKDGDSHLSKAWICQFIPLTSKKIDIGARVILMLAAAWVVWFVGIAGFWVSLLMSWAIHFLVFDYAVVYVLIKNEIIRASAKWYDYLNGKGFDNFKAWRNKAWYIRMGVRVAVFVIICIIYF